MDRILEFMYSAISGSSGMSCFWWLYVEASIFAFASGRVTSWFVDGSLSGDDVMSGGWIPFSQALTKAHVFVGELAGLRLLMYSLRDSCLAFIMILLLAFSFSLQAARLDLQLIPPFLGSHASLAFLAIATAFLHSWFHHGCLASGFNFCF